MKNLFFLGLILLASSCSQCYECSHTVEIISGNQVIEEQALEEFCTATPGELDDKEAAGFDCQAI